MIKYIAASLLAMLTLLVVDVQSADAAIVSRNNPYRSFNVSGVNYASMQWQRKNQNRNGSPWSSNHSSGRMFRRR
jgi:hypothetical protein